jgi:hypothetical protein
MTSTHKILLLALIAGAASAADFSYTMTTKSSGGPGGGDSVTKHYLKGQKMMIDSGSVAIITDFDSQTLTTINKTQKTYSVTKFADLGQASAAVSNADVKVDVKETGQQKNVNGYNASEVVMTMDIDMASMGRASQPGMKMQMEMDLWISPDVPGGQELVGFYKRNADRFPWASMASGANPSMRAAMADLQRKMAGLKGVPVLETVRMKNAGAGAGQADPRMAQARAQLEAMVKQGGPGAAQAQQALARMGGGSGGGALFETTQEGGNYSAAAIPDSVFAIPAGFTQSQK